MFAHEVDMTRGVSIDAGNVRIEAPKRIRSLAKVEDPKSDSAIVEFLLPDRFSGLGFRRSSEREAKIDEPGPRIAGLRRRESNGREKPTIESKVSEKERIGANDRAGSFESETSTETSRQVRMCVS